MKRLVYTLIMIAIALSLLTLPVSADTGPKPSVKITFTNVNDTNFYITLLSETDRNGPWTSSDNYDSSCDEYFPREVYDKFASYEDSDGFHFMQYGSKYDGNAFEWNYYPPSTFKPLLYFPEADVFVVGGIYERYAFDSYYELDVGAALSSKVILTESYDYKTETVSLLARIIITLASELLLAAFAFGYRGQKLFKMLVSVNLITQIFLNATVNIRGFFRGGTAFIATYIVLEIMIFVIEATIYLTLIPKLSARPASHRVAVIYALSANALSLILGLYLSAIIPKIF